MENTMDQEQQTTEVRDTTERQGNTNVKRQTVQSESTVSTQTILARVIRYFFGAISIFIGLRIVLLLLAANQGNPFVDFVYGVGGFFAAPFYGLFNYTPAYGSSVFEISSIVAILVYVLLAWGLVKLLTIGSNNQEV